MNSSLRKVCIALLLGVVSFTANAMTDAELETNLNESLRHLKRYQEDGAYEFGHVPKGAPISAFKASSLSKFTDLQKYQLSITIDGIQRTLADYEAVRGTVALSDYIKKNNIRHIHHVKTYKSMIDVTYVMFPLNIGGYYVPVNSKASNMLQQVFKELSPISVKFKKGA